MLSIRELREGFEVWAKSENLDLKRGKLDYADEVTYTSWCAWRAALSAAHTPPEIEPIYQMQTFQTNNAYWVDCTVERYQWAVSNGLATRKTYTSPPSPADDARADVKTASWLQINSVPKSGKVVWLKFRDGRVLEASWRTEDGREPSFVGTVCGLAYYSEDWDFEAWRSPDSIMSKESIESCRTNPADDELRKAAEDLIEYLDDRERSIHRVDEYMPLVYKLRAALNKGKS